MKFKILAARQIEKTETYVRFQYALNESLTYSSDILQFQLTILKDIPEDHIEYAIELSKKNLILLNGSTIEIKKKMKLHEWAPFIVMAQIFEYYKQYKQLPLILLNADQETRKNYKNEELIRNLF